MTTRRIDPPRSEFDNLRNKLQPGERRVIDLFDRLLPPAWEIYVQPHLNGLRPDIVLLNPNVGIGVFEIKDWDLSSGRYSAARTAGSDNLHLLFRDASGVLRLKDRENPVPKIRLYKTELFNLYCPRLNDRGGFAAITAGIIFTAATRSQVRSLLDPFRSLDEGVTKFPRYYPLASAEDVDRGDLDALFPEWKRTASNKMTPDVAEDLRGWLREPAVSREQRQPLEMDPDQRRFATTRTDSGYRRIKGPAGSGKSLVLAARAAELADQEKEVLVVTFNITLLNYLRDLAVRHKTGRKVDRRQIDFLNFHHWCKRMCEGGGQSDAYRQFWARELSVEDSQATHALLDGLADLVASLYDSAGLGEHMPRYDAILVDEGQDFRLKWWQTLRRALRPGGEMLLVADKTQNIYSTAAAWTEKAMLNAGFPGGDWARLNVSYRLPPAVIPLLELFASRFLRGEEADIPEREHRVDQMELADLFPVELRWVQLRSADSALDVCAEEVRHQMVCLREDTAVPDITFLSEKKLGRALATELEARGVHVLHTFDSDSRKARRQKRAFFQGDARVKATTLHSYKGWEARHLVLHVRSVQSSEDRALLYTALTRLRRHSNGSALTVVSECSELRSYGEAWPSFVET